jgi:4-amino-4-deoxy-L-arabinose transferase-like glycosyltransferase
VDAGRIFIRVWHLRSGGENASGTVRIGTMLLVYWLTRRLTNDPLVASVAMFVMLGTPYFIKYASHAVTDVPAAFLFACAIGAWSLAALIHPLSG